MHKTKALILALGLVLSLCACGAGSESNQSAINVSQSYGQSTAPVYEEAETQNELDKIYTDDYCSFAYNSKTMSISDLSDSSVTGSYLSVEPLGGMPEGSISHLEIFGGEKLSVPQDYTVDAWKEYAKELAASYYDDASNLSMSVPTADFSTENGIHMTATVCVAAAADVPAMTVQISVVNGENSSLVMIATSYENDPVDIQPFYDIMASAKVK